MAQHYFSFERERGGDWPSAVRQAEAAAGWNATKSNILAIAAGPVLSVSTSSAVVFNSLRFPVSSGNIEILASIRRGRSEIAKYTNGGPGIILRTQSSGDPFGHGYFASLGSGGDQNYARYINLARRIVGGETILGSSPNALSAVADIWESTAKFAYLRVRAVGTAIKVKGWWESDPEPSLWGIEVNRPANEESGGSCALFVPGRACLAEFKFVSMGTDGDTAPSAPPAMRTISGNATVGSGGPIALVLVIDAASGETYTTATPAGNGDWSASVLPGDYYVAYVNPGCQPIMHGPYHVDPG